jgi:hypothetical protein
LVTGATVAPSVEGTPHSWLRRYRPAHVLSRRGGVWRACALIDLGRPPSLSTLKTYVQVAVTSGYRYLCASDHLVFTRPWLDGLTTLAALIEVSEDMTLVTTAALPVVRGPVQTAKNVGMPMVFAAWGRKLE